MKKLLSLAAVLMLFTVTAAAQSPLKLSLYDTIAWPQANKVNVSLGLIDNNTPVIKGVDLNFISVRAEEMYGLQAAFAYARSYKMRGFQSAVYSTSKDALGVQWSLLNVADNLTGVQWGLVNVSDTQATGVQFGAVNFSQNMSGIQVGFYNQSQYFKGLQLGFVNNITTIDRGLQLGFVNIIKDGGLFPGMILVNGRF